MKYPIELYSDLLHFQHQKSRKYGQRKDFCSISVCVWLCKKCNLKYWNCQEMFMDLYKGTMLFDLGPLKKIGYIQTSEPYSSPP